MQILLPDNVQEQYRQYHEDENAHKWQAIDYIVDYMAEMLPAYTHSVKAENYSPLTGEGIGSALAERKANAKLIGQFAAVTSEDPSTVRERVRVGKYWVMWKRDLYSVLNYSQLRACLSAGEDKAMDYAKWAVEAGDDNQGRPAGARLIREQIKQDNNVVVNWVKDFNAALSVCERLTNNPTTPIDVRDAARTFTISTVNASQKLRRL